ncbi:MAG: hypothetical protein V4489_05180 [Chlamydiota bacterium]
MKTTQAVRVVISSFRAYNTNTLLDLLTRHGFVVVGASAIRNNGHLVSEEDRETWKTHVGVIVKTPA